MAQPLEQLDTLIDAFRQALTTENWQELGVLDGRVRPLVDAVMVDLRDGNLDDGLVRERLEELQAVCGQVQRGAEKARSEAKAALEEMSHGRKAARAYQDVSGGRSR